jgi:hypothetical protein
LEFKTAAARQDDVSWLLEHRSMWHGWPDSKAYVYERDAPLLDRFRAADRAKWQGQNEAVFRRITTAVFEARRRLRETYLRRVKAALDGE